MTGPKYGCGINVCKACTSLVDGLSFNPCCVNTSEFEGRAVTTIEGFADGETLHPVQQAWLEQDVPQCGYCQPGQIMQATALLLQNREPTDADIDAIENVCRCGTYFRVREAIKRAAQLMAAQVQETTPPPVVPEAPMAALLPAAALVAGAAVVAARRRTGSDSTTSDPAPP